MLRELIIHEFHMDAVIAFPVILAFLIPFSFISFPFVYFAPFSFPARDVVDGFGIVDFFVVCPVARLPLSCFHFAAEAYHLMLVCAGVVEFTPGDQFFELVILEMRLGNSLGGFGGRGNSGAAFGAAPGICPLAGHRFLIVRPTSCSLATE